MPFNVLFYFILLCLLMFYFILFMLEHNPNSVVEDLVLVMTVIKPGPTTCNSSDLIPVLSLRSTSPISDLIVVGDPDFWHP